MRLFAMLSVLMITNLLWSQDFQVTAVVPANQYVQAAPDGPIIVTFDQAVDPATLVADHFKVFGRWSGPTAVTLSLGTDNKTVTIQPDQALMYGEWVTVSLSKDINAQNGTPLGRSYTWNFWTKTNLYELASYQRTTTIELREPGEGLLQAYGAYAGDLNNDGYSDLTVVNETSDDLRIFLNDGTGQYADYEIIPLNSGEPSPNEGADFNHDGEIDLAVCTAHGDQLRVLFGDGTGTLSNTADYTTGVNARGLGVIDLNGDGNDDIVIANRESSNLTFFLNDGTGAFSSTTFETPGEGDSGLIVTDFNNDGIHDLVLGMYESQEIVVLIGDGMMGYTPTATVAVEGRPWMLAAGDVNGDGYSDVVSVNSTGHNVAVLLNDGNEGLLAPSYLVEDNADFPLAIDLGDLDGDGDLDIVSSYYSSANFLVFLNDGEGGFDLFQSLSTDGNASCAILHDRNNDGILDISATDEGDDLLLLFDGVGTVATEAIQPTQIIERVAPNPFSKQLLIELGEGCPSCQLAIYNSTGKLIRTIPADQLQLRWDGKTQNGLDAPAGWYLLQIQNGRQSLESYKVLKVSP